MRMLTLSVSLLAFLLVAGCSNSDSPAAATTSTGTFQVSLIDSPGPYTQVNIVVDSVQVHVAYGDSLANWITLNRIPTTYDLLKLVNGAEAVIGKADIPVGHYTQLRLFLGAGCTVVVDNVAHPLTGPSGSQSGIKLTMNADVVADVLYTITLDFDAARSIVTTGNPNSPSYILKPVIRAVVTGTTGIVAGTVSPASSAPFVYAATSTDTIATAADTTGGFKLRYLGPDTYSVRIVPQDTLHRDTTITGVVVSAALTTNLGTITLPAK